MPTDTWTHATTKQDPAAAGLVVPSIIRKTDNLEEFRRAVHDEHCFAAALPRPMDEKKQAAITKTAENIERFINEHLKQGQGFAIEISDDGLPKILDPENLLDDLLREELELAAKIYYERTGIPELAIKVFPDFKKIDHDHPYPLINIVWDKYDTENSEEIGTTYIGPQGREAAPLNALFWMQAHGLHHANRKTDNGITFIIRPTDKYAACMPDLGYYSENS